MAHQLWFKLTSAISLIILISVILTTLLTRQGADAHFAHFMVAHHMVRPEVLLQTLSDFYRQQNGWDTLQTQLSILVETSSDGVMGGMMGNMMGMLENRLQVADLQNSVVADTAAIEDSAAHMPVLLSGQAVQRWPILVDSQEVGTLLVEGAMMTASPMLNDRLLQGVTRAVLLAGLTAGVVGVTLAWLLVRQITRPLATLTTASERIEQGDLSARADVNSRDELGKLATSFNRMASSLQTQETIRSNLMADVAHELRTPLSGIQGTVEAIQDGIFPLTLDQIDSIHEQVSLLNRLVEDLRTLANVETGHLQLDKAPLDLIVLCENQFQAFQAQAVAQEIELRLVGNEEPIVINADGQRLGQILNNLLSNALRHTPAHGEVEMVVARCQKGVKITVTDSGQGIAAEDLPHIFDRFYRADHSRNRQSGGSGLGLAIARQLAETHGGKLCAESPPTGRTHGSRFMLSLPS